jgi:hypothetical protein
MKGDHTVPGAGGDGHPPADWVQPDHMVSVDLGPDLTVASARAIVDPGGNDGDIEVLWWDMGRDPATRHADLGNDKAFEDHANANGDAIAND